MEQKHEWHVGQKVWDDVHFPGQEGEIKEIYHESFFPVVVQFGTVGATYTSNGLFDSGVSQTLFPYPHKVVIEPIEIKPKVGDWGWFWDDADFQFGELTEIDENDKTFMPYKAEEEWFNHFSPTPPPHLVEALQKQGWEIKRIEQTKND